MVLDLNVNDFIFTVIIPVSIWLIKLSNDISRLKINQNKIDKNIDTIFSKTFKEIFDKLDKNREDLHQVNTKTEKILTKIGELKK